MTSPELTDRLVDIILCHNRTLKALARVEALLDGRLVISPDDLRKALDGPKEPQRTTKEDA